VYEPTSDMICMARTANAPRSTRFERFYGCDAILERLAQNFEDIMVTSRNSYQRKIL
jgi:hypothetical protein